jgi:hypothetical protein
MQLNTVKLFLKTPLKAFLVLTAQLLFFLLLIVASHFFLWDGVKEQMHKKGNIFVLTASECQSQEINQSHRTCSLIFVFPP